MSHDVTSQGQLLEIFHGHLIDFI